MNKYRHVFSPDPGKIRKYQCQLLTARLTRWSMALQEYDLEIIHIPGKDNIGADTLTTYPQRPMDTEQKNTTEIVINQLMLFNYSTDLHNKLKNLNELQKKDDKLNKLIKRIQSKPDRHFKIYQGILCSIWKGNRCRVMIPDIMKLQLIEETHQHFGHVGAYKTYHILRDNYQLSNMYNEIKKFTKSCELCQKSKISTRTAREPTISQIPDGPRQVVSLDLMGPLPRGQLGMKYLLVAVDIFSKYTKLYALQKATTDVILNKITNNYIPTVGKMKKILTDNGTQFSSNKWTNQLKQQGIQAIFTTTYHPESNPVERTNREIGRILRAYCHSKHTTWVKWIENIEFWLNNTTHHFTGSTPQLIMKGEVYQLPINKFLPNIVQQHPIDTDWLIQTTKSRLQRSAAQRNDIKDKNVNSQNTKKDNKY